MLLDICKFAQLSYLEADQPLTKEQEQVMREWANDHGCCVRQRSVRQETTMFKAGTLPLNMYQKQPVIPQERIILPHERVVQPMDSENDESEDEVVESDSSSEDEVLVYDSSSEEEVIEFDSSSDDEVQSNEPADAEPNAIPRDLAF